MLDSLVPQKLRIFYGWWISISFFVINFYWGGIFITGFTTFFTPLKDDFGFSSAMTSLAFSMMLGIAGGGAVAVGVLFDKIGGRALMLFATAFGGLGLILLSISHSTWAFFASFLVLSVGFTIFYAGIGPALAAHWFRRHLGKAMGILLAGTSLGGVLTPLLVWLIDTYDWRWAAVACAIGLFVIGIPTSLILRHRPEQYGLLPDGSPKEMSEVEEEWIPRAKEALNPEYDSDFTLKETVRTWTFWAIAVSQAIAIFGLVSVHVHIFPHLENEDFSRTTAARVVTIVTLMGLATRFGFGWLGDIFNRRLVLACAYILQGLGVITLAYVGSVWTLVIFIIVFGLAAEAYSAVMYSLITEYFGRAYIGAIYGMTLIPYSVGAVLGPYLAGVVFDATESYTLIFLAFGGGALLAAPVVLSAGRPVLRQPSTS